MKVAVLQSNYIPWKGYFDIIHDVDLFVFYDEVQYTKNDWRNRNRIETETGLKWLTIPCGYDIKRKIYEVKIKNEIPWQMEHYKSIVSSYQKAPFFNKYKDFLAYVYLDCRWEYLYKLNRYVIETISNEFLGINTLFKDSREFASQGIKDEKLISLLKSIKCDTYISGPAAKDYMDVQRYNGCGIDVIWKDYSGYPAYSQRFEPFNHQVSILDLLFNTGDDAPYYIWGWREK
ncbi:MAG: WbqC family protein [Oscillibacter sp.]|nr:WbqC family protein [Oscillibacter sp.]MCI9376904.1 WbqC family protein [Oscillibacter sp.]